MTTPKPEDMQNAKIAIVFTDIINSTKFVQEVGAHTAAIKFSQHDRFVMSLIGKFNGTWVDNSDGHLMYFDFIEDAIAFAFAYKEKLNKYRFPFKSRIGIHYDDMIIVKTSEKLIRNGVKRINIEGLGKNIAARTMSLCGPNQILLSEKAYLKFKSKLNNSNYIPKDALSALVGLYKFKGVSKPEKIYALGTEQSHLQPPPNSEKAKRLGGKNKIKTQLKHKKLKELLIFFYWRFSFIFLFYVFYVLYPFLSSPYHKKAWNLNYLIFKPFEYIKNLLTYLKGIL